MSEKTLHMEMGNLICRFGDQKVLLDLASDIVIPSFLDKKMIRTYNKTSYFFHDVEPVVLKNSEFETVLGLAGRFIKDTTLEREQIFEKEQGLVKKTGSMRSSPSAIFVLILNNHRLIYVKETKDAPSKETFRSTLLSFLREKHEQYIESEFNRLKNARENDLNLERTTKRDLLENTPKPTLDLIPLTAEDSIEEFVKKYDVLKSIEISLLNRNDESDNDPFFQELQKRKDAIGSKKSIVKHNNPGGLDKTKVISEIVEATEQGNQNVKLQGIDKDGDFLSGNNEKFQLRKPLEKLSNKPIDAAKDLYASFSGLIADGLVKVPETTKKTKILIDSLIQSIFK